MKHVELNVYRGKRPESFKALALHGVSDVINLESGTREFITNDRYEFEASEDFCITEHNVKCSNFSPPGLLQVLEVLDIIKKSKGNVYIHCLHGKDRTGFMCAAYRVIECGWTVEDAIEEMYANGFHKWSYFWWVCFLRNLVEDYE